MHLFIYLFIYFSYFFNLYMSLPYEVFFLRNIKTDSTLVTESNCQINRRH